MNTLNHFHRRIEEVKEDLLIMAGLVEGAIHDASRVLGSQDRNLAREVIENDRRIDLLQNRIEEKVFTLMATHQPVAGDLRQLSAYLKIVSFLERIGDQAVNLAQRALELMKLGPLEIPQMIVDMGHIAQGMTKSSLDAVVRRDVDLAAQVLRRDDQLDDMCRAVLEDMVGEMTREQKVTRRGVELILASRHLERIGDQACNIAEDVVFLVKGEIIRHRKKRDRDAAA